MSSILHEAPPVASAPRLSLPPGDAAKMLGVSVRKLHELRRAGLIAAVQAGSQTFIFAVEDLVAYIRENKTVAVNHG